MNVARVVRRFFLPAPLVTLLYWLKYRCFVSPKAEVEHSPNIKIGPRSRISSFSKIKATDGPLTIGANVAIGMGCSISPHEGGIEIGDDSMISANTVILGSNYRYDRLDVPTHSQGRTSKGVRIGKNVWIGAGCVVLDGAKIGDGTIVAPNSTISAELPENSISQGSPAKVVFMRR